MISTALLRAVFLSGGRHYDGVTPLGLQALLSYPAVSAPEKVHTGLSGRLCRWANRSKQACFGRIDVPTDNVRWAGAQQA
jgi:hypothetical protein